MKERNLKIVIQAVIAALTANFVQIFGNLNDALITLTIFIVLDIASGWIRAIIQKRLSSSESFRGTARKVLIYLLVAVATQVDKLMATDIVRNAVIIFYCVNEALSILENSVAAGLPVPNFLREVLQRLNPDKLPQERDD